MTNWVSKPENEDYWDIEQSVETVEPYSAEIQHPALPLILLPTPQEKEPLSGN